MPLCSSTADPVEFLYGCVLLLRREDIPARHTKNKKTKIINNLLLYRNYWWNFLKAMQTWTIARNLLLYSYSDIFVCLECEFCTSKKRKKGTLGNKEEKIALGCHLHLLRHRQAWDVCMQIQRPSKQSRSFSPNLPPEWRKKGISMPALCKRSVGGNRSMLSHWAIYRSLHADSLPRPSAAEVDFYYRTAFFSKL